MLSVREGAEFDQTAAGSVRAVLLMSFLGAALVLAAAVPAAHFLASRPAQVPALAASLALFAPGLVGYGLVACLSRVLLAARRTRAAAIPVAAGWLIVILADIVLVTLAPARWVVAMLALGNTIGLSAAGLALGVAVRRVRGLPALAGASRAAASGLAAAIAGAIAGTGVAAALHVTRRRRWPRLRRSSRPASRWRRSRSSPTCWTPVSCARSWPGSARRCRGDGASGDDGASRGAGSSRDARSSRGAGDPAERRLTVVFVLGLASGGTASPVGARADGCRTAGLAVSVLGPAPTLSRLPAGLDTLAVPIGDVPHPARDAAAFGRLRRWLAMRQTDVVHAHGVRAGAFAALAIASLRPRARP